MDERSSAFFALGLAKFTQNPVVLISTSGTAPANFYPAVIEASLSRVPLIILSADRPAYLIGTGANQTIDQQNLYGSHVRYFTDVGLPKDNNESLQDQIYTAFQRSSGLKLEEPPGPVHLNFPFDEPLLPENIIDIIPPPFTFENIEKPVVKFSIPILTESKRPLIIVGPMEGNHLQQEIIQLAEKMNAPILADPISQLRFGTDSELILANYDIFLRYKDIQPDLIIRFGRKPTSNVLSQQLEKWKPLTFLVDAWQQFNDDCPNFIQSRISDFCREQIKKINWEGSADWATQLISYENTVEDIIQPEMGFHEGAIAKCCVESIESGGQLFIGNSMPIRDVDMSTSTSQQFVTTYSNRGVSGIDGVVSTALGMCAEKNNTQSLLLIGDLSFYHDMNGLLAAKYGINLTIVVINNSGGGIFSFLPIANAGMENFQQFWTTDTGLNFKKAAELYNCWYSRAANVEELGDCIQKSFESSSIKIIEIRTDINENIENRRKFLKDVKQILSGI